jgi:hypothetical protein
VRYELSDLEWAAIKPLLPNKSRGVRRVNDRRVLNGIFGSCVAIWKLEKASDPAFVPIEALNERVPKSM